MKKIFSILLVAAIAFTLISTKVSGYVTDPEYTGVCKPKVSSPNELVCVITTGTKNCNADADCKPVTD